MILPSTSSDHVLPPSLNRSSAPPYGVLRASPTFCLGGWRPYYELRGVRVLDSLPSIVSVRRIMTTRRRVAYL